MNGFERFKNTLLEFLGSGKQSKYEKGKIMI